MNTRSTIPERETYPRKGLCAVNDSYVHGTMAAMLAIHTKSELIQLPLRMILEWLIIYI